MRRVVVTGLGVVSPVGIGIEEHWNSLLSGRSGIGRSQRLVEQGFPVEVAAEVSAAALETHMHRLPRKQLKLYSRVALFAMIASSLAAEDGNLGADSLEPSRVGVFLGTFFTGFDFSVFLRWMAAAESSGHSKTIDLPKATEYCISSINPLDYSLKTMPNLTAGHIAIAHNAQGFCRVIADGCTGGLHAVGQAFRSIQEGHLDVAFCGGAEAPLEEFVFLNFCSLEFLARGNGDSANPCMPFDVSRRGAVLGEGAGILLLEELEHARKRGARIYGELLGYGSTAGDAKISRPAPTSDDPSKIDGIKKRLCHAMKAALDEAGLDRVDLIAPNGDSTVRHDMAEALAIKEIFGEAAVAIPVSATKGAHGHMISASGAVELITCLMALSRGIIPPTINLREADPLCELDYVRASPRAHSALTSGLVHALGLSGESAAITVGKFCAS